MPLAHDWQPFKGYPKAALRASQRDCNNIPYKIYKNKLANKLAKKGLVKRKI